MLLNTLQTDLLPAVNCLHRPSVRVNFSEQSNTHVRAAPAHSPPWLKRSKFLARFAAEILRPWVSYASPSVTTVVLGVCGVSHRWVRMTCSIRTLPSTTLYFPQSRSLECIRNPHEEWILRPDLRFIRHSMFTVVYAGFSL